MSDAGIQLNDPQTPYHRRWEDFAAIGAGSRAFALGRLTRRLEIVGAAAGVALMSERTQTLRDPAARARAARCAAGS